MKVQYRPLSLNIYLDATANLATSVLLLFAPSRRVHLQVRLGIPGTLHADYWTFQKFNLNRVIEHGDIGSAFERPTLPQRVWVEPIF